MAWVKWTSMKDFNIWHEKIKTELGLPKPSVDEEGNILPDSIINTDYVLPVIVTKNDIRANIDDEYADGLDISENPVSSEY